MSQKRKRSPGEQANDEEQPNVFRSDPIEDRSSTFIGLYSPSLKPKELQSLQEITSASHKILAWRRESNQQAITGGIKYVTEHDDDGEKYAGKKISKVLDSMKVNGACVVARWYGGTLLGPVRFEHIENCAKEAVKKWETSVEEERSKRRKVEEDSAQKTKLVKVLADRDESIGVLRALATEKEEKAKAVSEADHTEGSSPGSTIVNGNTASQSAPNSKPAIDYAAMSLERLRALEKARDATLSFLLKRIDTAEAKLVSEKGSGPA